MNSHITIFNCILYSFVIPTYTESRVKSFTPGAVNTRKQIDNFNLQQTITLYA